MSHTATVKIEFRDSPALRAAVEAMGGTWLGEGTHRLYSSSETGLGFTLPHWKFPLIATANGTLRCDDYNGNWGDRADLEKLQARYAVERSRAVAQSLGWYSEAQPDGSLLVYHPTGGTITISAAGTVEANGFSGTECQEATAPIEQALGMRTSDTIKSQHAERRLQQGQS